MRQWDDAPTSSELRNVSGGRDEPPGFDLIAAVKGLHELTPQQLIKLIKDSGSSNVIQRIAEDGSQIQIDITFFARNLPLHIIAVTMAWKRDKSTFKYLLCGVLLLHAMCDLATRVPKIEEILLEDMKVSEQLIDLVFYLIVVLGAYRQELLQAPNDLVLLHSALVACGLKLLTVIISPQYEEVVQVLTAYPKTDTFIDAAFAAVCINVTVLQAKLSSQHVESRENTSPSDVETLIHLCQQCECSLHFLKSCCDQKLFREFIVRNKRLCGNGGVLSLVQAVMKLKLSPQYSQSPSYLSSVSRLKSQALSILQCLCEESATYLDEVVSTAQSRDLAESIALQVIELLKKMYGVNPKKLTVSSEIFHLKGQLELNAMRVADIFSDDSNFRPFFMAEFPEVLVALVSVPHVEFLSGWCSSHLPLSEDNATLDIPREIYAHTITSLLIKVIANLHCFVRDVCQDEKGLFLSKFINLLMEEPQEPPVGFPSAIASRTMTVRKNLCSLLSHAESLVPRFLNEEDVQLLRLFKNQFDTTVRGACEDHPIQIAQDVGVHSSPMHIEAAARQGHGDTNMEASRPKNSTFPDVAQLNSRTAKDLSIAGEMKHVMEYGKTSGSTVNVREDERDYRTTEASGSDSSPTRGTADQMDDFHFRGRGFEEIAEDGKICVAQSDETHQRKRKRPMMNDKQISLIETALVDEPNMHRNANSLKIWADRISLHGTEVTTSRLKNWLNNRKAKLARIAKDVRPPVEGGNLDRQGSSGQAELPNSPTDNSSTPSSAKGTVINEVADMKPRVNEDKDLGTSVVKPSDSTPPIMHFEPGQHVVLVGEKGEEMGKAKVFQVHGSWCSRNLEQSWICVVDVTELAVPRSTLLPHPLDATCNSFDQTETRLGLMRVFWDLNKVFHLPPQ